MNGIYENAVLKALESHSNISEIYLCTDNDVGGIDAAYRLRDILNEKGYTKIGRVISENKDCTAALHRIISQSALGRSSALPPFDCFFSLDIFILKNAFTQFIIQTHLFAKKDTDNVRDFICKHNPNLRRFDPNDFPNQDSLLPIFELYRRLSELEGCEFDYISATQERNRGAVIHSAVCEALGYAIYDDDGTYPDLCNQLLEIKLQTSPTIDLGLHSPEDGCCILSCYGKSFYSEDVRYAIFDGVVNQERKTVVIDKVYITNGMHFTQNFSLFQGKKQNAKIQLPLPSDFFNY